MSGPVLTVRNLTVTYENRGGLRPGRLLSGRTALTAVDRVSFELGAGETLAVVGESGCGKSTLARAVLRLVPTVSGSIVWRGTDLTRLNPAELRDRRRDFQIVFQDPFAALDPRRTIIQSVEEPLTSFFPTLDAHSRRVRALDALSEVGLAPDRADRYPHEFSGGQAQRVGIARAMVCDPRLVVCDEPLSALDISIRAQILGLLQRLQRDHDLALIFISHDLGVVRTLAHRVMVLYLGRVMEIGRADVLFSAPRHPYTRALLSAIPVPDPDIARTRPRLVLAGDLPSPAAPPSGCVFRTRCPHATAICTTEVPPLDSAGPDHKVACHLWDRPL